MTRDEAQRIVDAAHCRCDGYGVVPGNDGKIIPCPDCDGSHVTNEQLRAARMILTTTDGNE